MPTHGDYTVSILVNRRPLQEHDTDGSHGQSADQVKYVEAIEGAEFSIEACISQNAVFATNCKAFKIYMDGAALGYLSVRHDDVTHGSSERGWRNVKAGKHCHVNGQTMRQSFQFINLQTTEEKGDFNEYQRLARSAGSIRTEVYNVRTTREAAKPIERRISTPIPEKALKGRPIDMSAGLGQVRPSHPMTHITNIIPIGNHLVSFVFLYRSRRSLQMLNIIPTTPEPEPEPEPPQQQDPNSLSLEDARLLVSQYQAKDRSRITVKEEQTKVKSENKRTLVTPKKRSYVDEDDDECQIVSVKKAKPVAVGEVVVLDLT